MRALSARDADIARDPMMLATATTGEPFLMPRIPEQIWEQQAQDDEHLAQLLALDNHSGLLVALTSGTRILGTLALTTSNASGRPCGATPRAPSRPGSPTPPRC